MKAGKLLLAFLIVSCTFISVVGNGFAANVGYPWQTEWIQTNGGWCQNDTMDATANGSCYLGSMARFKTTTAIEPRVINITTYIYKEMNHDAVLGVTKKGTVSSDSAITTDYFTFVSTNKFSFEKGHWYYYQVSRNGLNENIYGKYWAYMTDSRNVKKADVLTVSPEK